MNRKQHFWNRLLAAFLLAALLMAQITPAFALEGEPTTGLAEAAEPSDEPAADDGEGTDTSNTESPSEAPETAIQTVSTPEELLQAIEQAENGDVIGVGCEIRCMEDTTLGSPDKVITIQRIAPEGHVAFCSDYGTGDITIQNIIFDGAEIESIYSFVVSNTSSTFTNCSFQNCFGGNGAGLYTTGQNVTLTGCVFDNNSGPMGAHLRIDGGNITVQNCTFTNGTATIKGGAIMTFADRMTITGCTITGNTSAQHGGGIWNSGNLKISQSKIYGNTSNGEADDLVNEYWGQLALMDDHAELVSLYEPDGMTPNKWMVDTFLENPSNPDSDPNMVFSMTFAVNDPEPDPEPEPNPTPDPEPIPDPEPEEPAHSSHSRPSVRPSTTQTEAPKEIALTNGKAVLKAPEALYWDGYETSRGIGSEAVTRADLAALVGSMMDQESKDKWATDIVPFDDVNPGKWYAAAIGTASNAGIMVGCGNGNFAPERQLTWGELITVFSRFTDDEPPTEVYTGEHWAKDSINTAIFLGWIEYSEEFDPGGVVTCGEMVSFIQAVFQWAAEKT